MPFPSPQVLLIDADDTLWENNIYFERAVADFTSFLNHREFTPEQVSEKLNDVQRECIRRHGYGLNSFVRALADTFERLSVEPLTPALRETIHGFARAIAEHPIEIIPGVEDTLAYLSPRHRLILMTKGDRLEQAGKIERSGLQRHFQSVEIVAEKDTPTYTAIVQKHNLQPGITWMVGNSPKSDINPALLAGLHAVFVPHDNTWVLEHEELCQPPQSCRLLVLERFEQLCERF
jgi:putative hydrolase of the HAD superfamily